MQLYKSLLKLVVIILAVPFSIGIIILLFWVGFGLDYGSKSSSAYTIVLPFGFILIVFFGLWNLYKRSKNRNYENIRQEVRQELNAQPSLTDSPELNFLELLTTTGPLSTEDIALRLRLPSEDVIEVARNLLISGKIKQKIENGTAIFFLPH